MRAPAVAGQFYAGSDAELREQIQRCYTHELGPGKVPAVMAGPRKLLGMVSPHAGYQYSGPVAAHGFSRLAGDGRPDSFVLIGPNHHGIGSGVSIMTSGRWLTPLGEVEIDRSLAEAIRGASDIIDTDEVAHAQEHSIEVQLPFLQHLFGDEFKFVPICMMLQDEETSEDVGRAIADGAGEKDVVIIASTDFTHCGPMYGQLPPGGQRADEFARRQDERAIVEIVNLNPKGLFKAVRDHQITMCGHGCVAAMLFAVGERRGEGELLKYATSYDIAPGPNAVGYGSIVIWRKSRVEPPPPR